MQELRTFVARWPRLAAAVSFGASTALLTQFAWYPSARMNGMFPALTVAAGLAHAIGGAVTGPRLLDPRRTCTSVHAALLGAGTSLLAVAIFAPAMAVYVSIDNVLPVNPLGYLILTIFTGLFAFLGAGWALLLLSAAVGFGLYRFARSSAAV